MGRKFSRHYTLRWLLPAAVALFLLVSGQPPASAEDSPTLTLSPSTAVPNQHIAVTGEYFTTGGSATLASLTISGVAVASEKINFGSPVTVDSSGRFVANLIVPLNSKTFPGGSVTVAATDSQGVSATATLAITKPLINASPVASRIGSTVKVSGSGFPIDSYIVGADELPKVEIRYYLTDSTYKKVATVYPDSTGAFTVEFDVPSSATAPSSENQVEAAISGISSTVTTKHSIKAPTITLSPATGLPDDAVTVSGTDFPAFTHVSSLSIGKALMDIPHTVVTDADGRFSLSTTIPPVEAGIQPVSAKVGGSTYTSLFTVQDNSPAPVAIEISTGSSTYELTRRPDSFADNVQRVFYFDNTDKTWSFFDRDPQFEEFSTLTELVPGNAYWINAKRTQNIVVAGASRYLIEGWNLVAW